jgi:SanA protein
MRIPRPADPTKRLVVRVVRVVVIAALSGGGALAGATVWVNATTRSRTYHTLAAVPERDVIVVPGIGARSGRVPLALHERLETALTLYRAQKAPAILVSGVGESDSDEITTMVGWLTARGVDPTHILSDPAGYRTLDTMKRAAHTLGVSRAIVVTQGLYIPRTLFLARASGIDAVGFVAPSTIPMAAYRLRTEAAKSGLALADIYLLGTNPRYTDGHGARLSQPVVAERAPASVATSADQPPAAFSFLTSAISAGTAASHVATSP